MMLTDDVVKAARVAELESALLKIYKIIADPEEMSLDAQVDLVWFIAGKALNLPTLNENGELE